MDLNSVFTDSKWNILMELVEQDLSPSELANKTGTTIANISTQIKLLEALGFVDKKPLKNIAQGQPRKMFSLKKEVAYLVLATRSVMGKKMFRLNNELLFYFAVWMINDSNVPQVLIKLYAEHEDKLKHVQCIGYLGSKVDEIEILVIHEHEDYVSFLKNMEIVRNEKKYKIKPYIHTLGAFIHGATNNEEYFLDILKKVFIITDKHNHMSKLKRSKK